MGTIGIYVENHEGVNRDFFIWIRFDHRKIGETVSLALLLEGPLISETCPLEENASHHHGNHETFDFMTSCPGDPGGILETSKDSQKTLQNHGTSKH